MSGIDLVVDTNILIYLTSGNKSVAKALRNKNFAISFITEMELLSWPLLSEEEILTIKKLVLQCKVIDLNEEIKETAIDIRRKTKLKLPDAIICATSVYIGQPLLSADKLFKKVNDLDLLLITI